MNKDTKTFLEEAGKVVDELQSLTSGVTTALPVVSKFAQHSVRLGELLDLAQMSEQDQSVAQKLPEIDQRLGSIVTSHGKLKRSLMDFMAAWQKVKGLIGELE